MVGLEVCGRVVGRQTNLLVGYIESKTKYHKTATSLLKKQKFMPLVAPVLGVTWLDSMAFLKVDIDKKPFGAICRAPRADGVLGERRCFFEEIVTFTNRLLSATTDSRVTSHSFKHTTLSWCAAYGLPEASRSLLGHHEVSSKPLMVYSRDMLSGPLQLYGSMLQNIRDDHFRPDESRTSRLVAFLEHAEHADNVPHPTPPDSMAGLASFEVMKKWMDRLFAMYSQVPAPGFQP